MKILVTEKHEIDKGVEPSSVPHSGNIRQSTIWGNGQNKRLFNRTSTTTVKLPVGFAMDETNRKLYKTLDLNVGMNRESLLRLLGRKLLMQKENWLNCQMNFSPTILKLAIPVLTTEIKTSYRATCFWISRQILNICTFWTFKKSSFWCTDQTESFSIWSSFKIV